MKILLASGAVLNESLATASNLRYTVNPPYRLIAFLRAYLSQPSILILDEATSSVDSYAERLIQYATETITKGRTSIIIAHRLATIKQADKIIVMDKGRIVEEGTHDELLQRENGYYKNLYDKQFGTKKAS